MELTFTKTETKEFPRVQVTLRGDTIHLQAGEPGQYLRADFPADATDVNLTNFRAALEVSATRSLAGTPTPYLPLERHGEFFVTASTPPVLLCRASKVGQLTFSPVNMAV